MTDGARFRWDLIDAIIPWDRFFKLNSSCLVSFHVEISNRLQDKKAWSLGERVCRLPSTMVLKVCV